MQNFKIYMIFSLLLHPKKRKLFSNSVCTLSTATKYYKQFHRLANEVLMHKMKKMKFFVHLFLEKLTDLPREL